MKFASTACMISQVLENFMEKDNGPSERSTLCIQGLFGMEWPEEGAI